MSKDYDKLLKYVTAAMALEAKGFHSVLFVLRDMRHAPKVETILKNNGIKYMREEHGFQVVRSGSELVDVLFDKFNEVKSQNQNSDLWAEKIKRQFGA